jgi:hypothetical protein
MTQRGVGHVDLAEARRVGQDVDFDDLAAHDLEAECDPRRSARSPDGTGPQVGAVLLEAVRHPRLFVHRSHTLVAWCHSSDR